MKTIQIAKRILLISILILAIPNIFLFAAQRKYAVMKLNGTVNSVSGDFLVKSIKDAKKKDFEFILILMDTPGGRLDSTQDIIKAIMSYDDDDKNVPVVVYTYPNGAQAASAGGLIMLSAHIGVMAPGTRIGAIHPYSPQLNFSKKDNKGNPAGTMEKKVLNDTIAYARSIAQKRGRNINWAISAVKDAKSSTYIEALSEGVIDFIADDIHMLMKKLHGRVLRVNGKMKKLNTRNLVKVAYTMSPKDRFFNRLAHPEIVMILFLLAIVGLGLEFKNPGMIVPGAIGGISLILFLMVRKFLPFNVVGLLLIITSLVLFVLELKVASYGLLTLGGLASFIIGAMMLFDSPLPGGHIPLSTIIITVLVILGFIFTAIRAVFNVHRGRVTTGKEGLIGETGKAIKDFSGKGKILIHGEIWNAECNEPLLKEDKVTVIEVHGMNLTVEKKKDNN